MLIWNILDFGFSKNKNIYLDQRNSFGLGFNS